MKVWNARCSVFGHGYMTMARENIKKVQHIYLEIGMVIIGNDHTGYKQVEHIYLEFGMVIWQ